jgi:hypothetical protein
MVTVERPEELTVRLRAAPEYVIGLPFFVEVTLANDTEGAEYYSLSDFDPLEPPFPVEFTFSTGEQRLALPARSSMRGERRRGFDLSPNESHTVVLDLSELEPRLEPGQWQMQARWVMRHEKPCSTPVPVMLFAAEPTDAPLLDRLRHADGALRPSWANLLRSRSALDSGEELRGLSEQARRALVPYLILHQAIHGPEPLATFPLDFLAAHDLGPWASEAGILGYELLQARRAPDLAQQRERLLQRWPGLAFRVREIDAGAGLLTLLRSEYGPESPGR